MNLCALFLPLQPLKVEASRSKGIEFELKKCALVEFQENITNATQLNSFWGASCRGNILKFPKENTRHINHHPGTKQGALRTKQRNYLPIKKNQENVGPQISFTLPKLLVGLPLQSETDIHELEIHLSSDSNLTRLGAYLASIGGKTLASRTYGVLKQLLSDNVASGYNFYGVGKNNKKAFSKLTLTKLILYAVKVGYSQATDA
ncbi:hypothetical protein ACJJTC_001852 [Scirpophaga incertulas]